MLAENGELKSSSKTIHVVAFEETLWVNGFTKNSACNLTGLYWTKKL